MMKICILVLVLFCNKVDAFIVDGRRGTEDPLPKRSIPPDAARRVAITALLTPLLLIQAPRPGDAGVDADIKKLQNSAEESKVNYIDLKTQNAAAKVEFGGAPVTNAFVGFVATLAVTSFLNNETETEIKSLFEFLDTANDRLTKLEDAEAVLELNAQVKKEEKKLKAVGCKASLSFFIGCLFVFACAAFLTQ
jgi:hypothetical protein